MLRKSVPPLGVELDKDEQQDREAPQGRSAVTKEWQWDADGRYESNGHSNVDDPVGK